MDQIQIDLQEWDDKIFAATTVYKLQDSHEAEDLWHVKDKIVVTYED